MMLRNLNLRLGLVTLALVAGIASTAAASGQIVPVQSNPFGLTYGEWSARWWQWAMSLPIDRHPLFDTAPASEGQTSPVWFLGASFSPSVTDGGQVIAIANRTITVPVGIALFFPVLNAEASTLEGNGTTEAELRAAAQSFQDLGTNMSCEIDGESVSDLDSYRVQSPLFIYGPLPENNIPQSFGLDAPAGTTSPSVGDGVYLMLSPLRVGQHTIHFHGEVPDFNFLLDITYNITVERRTRSSGSLNASGLVGGDETNAISDRSWSAVKDLYRR